MTLWMLSQLALAAPEPSTAPEAVREERRVRLPPVRLGGAAAARASTQSTGELELGVQPWRSQRLSLEAYARYQGHQWLMVPQTPMGNRPNVRHLTATASLLVHIDRMVAVGPELAAGVRTYHQDWNTIGSSGVLSVGAAAQISLFRAPTWGVALTLRLTAEPLPTSVSFPTQEVVRIDPIQAFLGTRVLFGHGRVNGSRL